MEICAGLGCDKPGTSKCSACKNTPYCGPICQTADWSRHKEECPGHLRKLGLAHLVKAKGFFEQRNWSQSTRYSDLALTKFKQMKDRPIEAIDEVLRGKFYALNALGRHRDALECAKERYCLTNITNYTHPPAIEASFSLIESCIQNREFFDAELYSRVLWETLTLSRDGNIPEDLQQSYLARGATELARAILLLAKTGILPAKKSQAAGQEAITLARRVVEIHTRLLGIECYEAAVGMLLLAQILDHFNDVNDDEILRLYEQAKPIFVRVQGTLSVNVAMCEKNMGLAYKRRANRANFVEDVPLYVANLELAMPRLREAIRLYSAMSYFEESDRMIRETIDVEQSLQQAAVNRVTTGFRKW